MTINIVAAKTSSHVIGNMGKIPWDIPEDWAFFLRKTYGHLVIMGTYTYHTVPPAEANKWQKVVISSTKTHYEDAVIKRSLAEAIGYAKEIGAENISIIGGERLFEEGLQIADKLFLTIIHNEVEGDRFFPIINPQLWKEIKRSELFFSVNLPYKYYFTEWESIKSASHPPSL